MRRYTFIADFRGGTYLAQLDANDPSEASRAWARAVELGVMDGLDESCRPSLVAGVEDEDATEVEGLSGVWCLGLDIDDDLMLVHVVEGPTHD